MPKLTTRAGTGLPRCGGAASRTLGCPGPGCSGPCGPGAALGLRLGSPVAQRHPQRCGLPAGSAVVPAGGLRGAARSVLAAAGVPVGSRAGPGGSAADPESGSILRREPNRCPSDLSTQTPSPSTVLSIYGTQGIMHLFKCIINVFKCVRLYQNAYQSLPVRPRVTSLAKRLLLARQLAFLLSERAIAGFIVAEQPVEVDPGCSRCLVRVPSRTVPLFTAAQAAAGAAPTARCQRELAG